MEYANQSVKEVCEVLLPCGPTMGAAQGIVLTEDV